LHFFSYSVIITVTMQLFNILFLFFTRYRRKNLKRRKRKNYYNNTHKEYARRKKWTTPKEGTRKINKSLKKKNLENEILKTFLKTKLNTLFYKNNFSVCQLDVLFILI
jgi:hypothetical protein